MPQTQVDVLKREAIYAYPRECCGLLIGYGDTSVVVTGIIKSENRAVSRDRFVIDTQLQFDLVRKLRGTDRRVLGPYHSHPNGRAEPSKHDEEMAIETGQIWLIVPVQNGKAQALRAYQVVKEPGSFMPISFVES